VSIHKWSFCAIDVEEAIDMFATVTYKLSRVVLLTLLLSVGMLQEAEAHRVTVFAWVEGDMVHTQSKFSGGRKAQNAPIQVYDHQGNLQIEGKTDAQGQFTFKAPGKMDLKIVLAAGAGHRAEYSVSAAEFGDTVTAKSAPVTEMPTSEVDQTRVATAQALPQTSTNLSRAELQQIVEATIDKKLQPVIHMLTEAQTAGPTFQDIIGGIGYIFGLVGVAMYFRYRK
jgi:nickel transport protein